MYRKNSDFQLFVDGNSSIKETLRFLMNSPFSLRRYLEFKKIKSQIANQNFKVDDIVFISSESRSGSTWLMEILSSNKLVIPNWEPLNPKVGVIPKQFNWGDRPLVVEDEDTTVLISLMREILLLKRLNYWTASFIKLKNIQSAQFVLTKSVRSNLLLPWLTANIKFKRSPILLLRHPITTVLSQQKNFNRNNKGINKFIVPECANNTRYVVNLDYINSLSTHLERMLAIWCINNVPTINHSQNDILWKVIYFENIFLNPKIEIEKIRKDFDLDINLENLNFDKPSASSNNLDKVNKLEGWANDYSIQSLQKFQDVFDHFGLKDYSAFSPYPLIIK